MEAARAIASAERADNRLMMLSLFGRPELPAFGPLEIERLSFGVIKSAAARAAAPQSDRRRMDLSARLLELNPELDAALKEYLSPLPADPAGDLSRKLQDPSWKEHVNKDFAGFIRRLHDFLENKRTGRHFDKINYALIPMWTHDWGRLPPYCLLTNKFLACVLRSSEEAIKQRVNRDLKLYRPSRPRISMDIKVIDGKDFLKLKWKRKGGNESDLQWQKFYKRWMFEPPQSDKDDSDP